MCVHIYIYIYIYIISWHEGIFRLRPEPLRQGLAAKERARELYILRRFDRDDLFIDIYRDYLIVIYLFIAIDRDDDDNSNSNSNSNINSHSHSLAAKDRFRLIMTTIIINQFILILIVTLQRRIIFYDDSGKDSNQTKQVTRSTIYDNTNIK